MGAALTGDVVVFGIPRISDPIRHSLMTEHLAGAGYLATMVDFQNVEKAVQEPSVASAIQWPLGRRANSASTRKTLSVFVCMAARFKDIPAGKEEDRSSPATQSSVWNVPDALGKSGVIDDRHAARMAL